MDDHLKYYCNFTAYHIMPTERKVEICYCATLIQMNEEPPHNQVVLTNFISDKAIWHIMLENISLRNTDYIELLWISFGIKLVECHFNV